MPKVHLLGLSHGAFVAAYHALYRLTNWRESCCTRAPPSPAPEHSAEAGRMVEAFAAKHAGCPGLPEVMAAIGVVGGMSADEQTKAVARGVLPWYFADYWGDEERLAPFRDAVRAPYIWGLYEDFTPDAVDDRTGLKELAVPALVVVGRHDVICGMRWGLELDELIPDSRLLVLENSGHMGHLEEPETFADGVRGFVLGTTNPRNGAVQDGTTARDVRRHRRG
ncbi:alpha/beta hydrolase [Streptomyces sp. NPDC097727]|uniref:alpha/beta hydrolase n=1 Tax=Streptomyces sp. NPDC097727 TaxID=3366092 RepID=UPI00380A3AC7